MRLAHPITGPVLGRLVELLRATAPTDTLLAECERVRALLDTREAEATVDEGFDAARDLTAEVYKEIRSLVAHDSNWWVGAAEAWANANKAVLAQYLLARNGGQIESHAH